MGENTNAKGFALLFSSNSEKNTYALYVSTPPPLWLADEDKTRLTVTEAGMYMFFFSIRTRGAGSAFITVNDSSVSASRIYSHNGEISSGAICTVRPPALPCTLGAKAEGDIDAGVILIAKI